MAKASPGRTSFNAGVFSVLVEGRIDYERYPSSMREMVNMTVTPQGPASKRSGTVFQATSCYEDKYSSLIPFIYNEEQALWFEFSDRRMRFHLESGVQAYPAVAVTHILDTAPMRITSASLAADVGDQVLLYGLPVSFNGVKLTVAAKSGNDYTFDLNYPGAAGAVSGVTAQRIYHVSLPYSDVEARGIRTLSLQDVVYLFVDGYRNAKLQRYGDYDWRFSYVSYTNGPFMPATKNCGTLTLSATGNAIPNMTSNTLPSGTASASTQGSGGDAYRAFDADPKTYWFPTTNQSGYLQYDFGSAVVIVGYVIYRAKEGTSTDYSATDYAPGSWEFQGSNDGTNWTTLDAQTGFVLYEGGRTPYLAINNTTAYRYYRIDITECTRNGTLAPRIARLTMRSNDDVTNTINITMSGDYSDINSGQGFLDTDIDRLMRLKGVDNFWRVARITGVNSATNVDVLLLDEPFLTVAAPVLEWQLGYWSDTTGWPSCGTFFDDRVWLAGARAVPDLLAATRPGAYEDFAQRNAMNEVLDDSALVVRLNSRLVSRVRWMSTDERGLLIGTGTSEWVVTGYNTTDNAITARNIKARTSTERGSADIEPIKIDRQVLFIPRSRRLVREFAYAYEVDGYRSPSMSLFASHLGVKPFAGMSYQAEPHSIVWVWRDDGSVIGLTYNREQDVIGWHEHDFGGEVTSIATIPSTDARQDTVMMVIDREIDGVQRRYIERIAPLWDFGNNAIEDAVFVDCSFRYEGDMTDTLTNLWALEGSEVDVLVDGVPIKGLVVNNATLELPVEGMNIVVGKRYEARGEISRIEAGATDGTSQGKMKRVYEVLPFLWDSYGGQIATFDEDKGEFVWDDILYPERYDILEPVTLQTCVTERITLSGGYGKRGTVAFRHDEPLPFNIIAMYPHMTTQE